MSLRRKNVRTEASLDEILDSLEGRVVPGMVDLPPNPEKICSNNQIDELIDEETQKLPAKLQRAFQLREIEDLSTEESMRTLGIRKSAFKSRLRRARLKMTGALQRSLRAPVQRVAAIGADSSKGSRQRRSRTGLFQ
jgi:DNA-directed RNA polymerase specialized sigma24 family protein